MRQLGLAGDVTIIMHDTSAQQVEALRDGAVSGLIGTNAYQYGYQAVVAMDRELSGQNPSVTTLPPERFITTANIDDDVIQGQYIYKESCE